MEVLAHFDNQQLCRNEFGLGGLAYFSLFTDRGEGLSAPPHAYSNAVTDLAAKRLWQGKETAFAPVCYQVQLFYEGTVQDLEHVVAEHTAAGILPVVKESLGGQQSARHELAENVEDPARMHIVEEEVAALLAGAEPHRVGHVRETDLARMAAVHGDRPHVARGWRRL